MPDIIDDKICGLDDAKVKVSRAKYGENCISAKKRKGFFFSFLESFGDPMIKILLAALMINIILILGDTNWFEPLAIGMAILLATLVSTLSEYGSESAFEKLQEQSAQISCRVIRRNKTLQLPMREIVVGDIVLLQPGDRIPADGVIIKGALNVDQSSLNGETKEAKKYVTDTGGAADQGFLAPSALYSASVVCSGEALMRVANVGDKTYYGKIGSEIQTETRESPLRHRLKKLASSIGKFGYIAAGLTALAYLINTLVLDNNFNLELIRSAVTTPGIILPGLLKAATLAVTVIVMAVPEGLPMMITVVLSANMKRMLRDNVLVRKLVGIETAGSLNILFCDKTGTLTQGKPRVENFISGSGDIWTKQEFMSSKIKLREILYDCIYYNSAAIINTGKEIAVGGNATDRAALEFVCRFNLKRKTVSDQFIRGKSIPFSGESKFMATTVACKAVSSVTGKVPADPAFVRGKTLNQTFIKGAPEKILPYCEYYYDKNGIVQRLTDKNKSQTILKNHARKSARILAVAVSSGSVEDGFSELSLVGFLSIRDEVRPESAASIKQTQKAGIQVVMLTGDSKETALAIAKDTSIFKSGDIVLTSNELNAMSDDDISKILFRLKVVARALPADKSRLIRISQRLGLVAGMTGDGVNDAPALKQADVGFAMGSGTEVAKEAGDIVILDDNFNSIAKAICYGRTIFKNIRKFIIYQMSICMCAAGVTILGPFFGIDLPITVIQMLWINIVMDTLAGLAFSAEKARTRYMEEPPKRRSEPMLNSYMKGQIAITGIFTTFLCIFFLKHPLFGHYADHGDIYRMTAFFALFMFLAVFISFCSRTHRMNLLESLFSNKTFILIMTLVLCIQIIIIYYGGTIFRTAGLGLTDLSLIVLLSASIFPIDFLRKAVTRRLVGSTGI